MDSLNKYTHTKEKLLVAGLKATHPRIAVLHELFEMDTHPSAEQLYERISPNNPSISVGSVHRILDDLVSAGLVSRVATKSGLKRYDGNRAEHSHIYATNTEEIQDYHDVELNEMLTDYFKSKKISNFSITEIKLQINGTKLNPDEKVTIK